ncbi:MAG TPA: DUF309 domain-containing protein [Thermoanaerobaculia bacterium]|nr:DUF309 domain-containing protein [Thermoanaerobaculia bacterium]
MSDEPDSGSRHRSSLAEGISLFNDRKFWHAHEAWERDWLAAEGDEKIFLQGLIQLAAAYHHVQRGTFSGGVRLFDAALEKLARVPGGYAGVDRSEAVTQAAQHREHIAQNENIDGLAFPKLRYN